MLKSTLALYILWDSCLIILGLGALIFTVHACFCGLVRFVGYCGGQYSELHAAVAHKAAELAYNVWYYVAAAIGGAAAVRLLGLAGFPTPPPPLITIFACIYIVNRTTVYVVERALDARDRGDSTIHFLLRVVIQGLSYILCGSLCCALQNIVLDGCGPATTEFARYLAEAVFMYCILGDLDAETAETVATVQALVATRIADLRTSIDELTPLWTAVRKIKAFCEHVVMVCVMLIFVLCLRIGWALLTEANSSAMKNKNMSGVHNAPNRCHFGRC